MADPIDELETLLESAVERNGGTAMLPMLYQVIDKWRHYHGGNRAYIATRSKHRTYSEIVELADAGLDAESIANRVGLSASQVRRVRAKRSSYL